MKFIPAICFAISAAIAFYSACQFQLATRSYTSGPAEIVGVIAGAVAMAFFIGGLVVLFWK
jgi:hypothetical protein